jgi:hypothetical protein
VSERLSSDFAEKIASHNLGSPSGIYSLSLKTWRDLLGKSWFQPVGSALDRPLSSA